MYLIHSFLPGGEPGESCTHNNSVAAFCWPVYDVVDKEKGKIMVVSLPSLSSSAARLHLCITAYVITGK